MNEIKIENYFGLKPVLIGYDRNYCTYRDFSVRISILYFCFFYWANYKITIFNNTEDE